MEKHRKSFFIKNVLTIIVSLCLLFNAFACGTENKLNTPDIPDVSVETYYNVVFVTGEETVVRVKGGGKIAESDIPTTDKTGYRFLGWLNGAEYFDLDTAITTDLRLIAAYEKEITDPPATISLNKYKGGEVSVLPIEIKDYIAITDENEIAEHLYKYQQDYRNASAPSGVEFSWESVFDASYYTFYLSVNENFSGEVYSKKTTVNSIVIYNLIPNAYFWKVESDNGEYSDVDSFRITETIRAIKCGNITNMRDEGGYVGEFGRVKYGLVYRSADIAVANASAKTVLKQLGLKTEIDLRLDTPAASSPDPSITLVKAGIWMNDYIFPDFNSGRPFSQTYADNLKTAFKLFTDESNYPIDFHCSAGADRTVEITESKIIKAFDDRGAAATVEYTYSVTDFIDYILAEK